MTMTKKKTQRWIKVKGIPLSEEEYEAFVDYLNRFRIQKFTRQDVIDWLEHYYSERALDE